MHGVIYNVLPNAFNFFETCCFIYLFLISRKVFTKIHFNVIKLCYVYWREGTLRLHTLHRPTSTAEQGPQMWIGGKRPHHSYPFTRQSGFSFPLWTLLLFACWLSLRGGGRSWLLTHYLFSTWVRNSCQGYFFHITVSSTKTCYSIAPCHLK